MSTKKKSSNNGTADYLYVTTILRLVDGHTLYFKLEHSYTQNDTITWTAKACYY